MSDLTKGDVQFVASFEVGARNGDSRQEVVKDVIMTLTAQGDGQAGSNIPASAFNLESFYPSETPFIKSDDSEAVIATPSYDGSSLLLLGLTSTSIGTAISLEPAQYTGTFKGRIRGNAAAY